MILVDKTAQILLEVNRLCMVFITTSIYLSYNYNACGHKDFDEKNLYLQQGAILIQRNTTDAGRKMHIKQE